MGKIIAISNHKGGVGKTTSALNIGAGLALKGIRTLLVDLDPQANLSISLGIEDPERSIYHAIRDQEPPVVVPIRKNLDLAPSSLDLIRAEVTLRNRQPVVTDPETIQKILQPIRDQYQAIILDCPPSLGNLTISGLIAADLIMVPIEAEYLALKGYRILSDTIKDIGLTVDRVFITKYDNRKTLNRTVMETIRAALGKDAFKTVIRSNVTLAEAPIHQKTIYEYSPNSHGAKDYGDLVQEIIKLIK